MNAMIVARVLIFGVLIVGLQFPGDEGLPPDGPAFHPLSDVWAGPTPVGPVG
jgi:hypothetical protein